MKKPLMLLAVFSFVFSAFSHPVSATTVHDMSGTDEFNIRIDGVAAGDWVGYGGLYATDLNGNGRKDLIVGSWFADNNATTSSGSVWVIYDDILADVMTGTGNVLDLADSDNWNIRFDGAGQDDYFGVAGITSGDIDDDDVLDLLMVAYGTDYNGRTDSGSVFVVYGSQLDDFEGTGNIVSMGDSASWNLRIDGAAAGDTLALVNAIQVIDLDQNGTEDLLVGSRRSDENFPPDAGSLWIIYGEELLGYSGTGNTLDLADPDKWNIRYDGGADDEYLSSELTRPVDLDGDGILDLMISAYAANNNIDFDEGSFYIVPGSLVDDYIDTGNIVSLAVPSNFSIRFDSQDLHSVLGVYSTTGDFDGDGAPDLVVSAIDADKSVNGQGKGWMFIFFNEFLNSFEGTGNIRTVATTTEESTNNYNIRYIGSQIKLLLGGDTTSVDWDNSGSDDLFFSTAFASDAEDVDITRGALYGIFEPLLNAFSGTGNDVVLGDESTYSVRFDGFAGSYFSSSGTGIVFEDIDDDGSYDILTSARGTDYNGRSDSGSVYIIFNFPHTITVDASAGSLSGTVAYPDSVTDVDGVAWSTDDDPQGLWTPCNLDTTSPTEASFECDISELTGDIRVYVRAQDENGVLTPQALYAAHDLELENTDEEDENGSDGSSGSHRSSWVGSSPNDDTTLLESLQARIEELKTILASLLGSSSDLFARDLDIGSEGVDVLKLQEFLISHSNGSAALALKTHGLTDHFGPLTQATLAEYQASVGITPAVGFFGPVTRSYLNSL